MLDYPIPQNNRDQKTVKYVLKALAKGFIISIFGAEGTKEKAKLAKT